MLTEKNIHEFIFQYFCVKSKYQRSIEVYLLIPVREWGPVT